MTTKPAHTHVYILGSALVCWISIKHCQKQVFSEKHAFWTTNDAILFLVSVRVCAHLQNGSLTCKLLAC